jgi:hypothetical protein
MSIVATPPPGNNSVCRQVAHEAPTHRNTGRDAIPSGSLVDTSSPAQDDFTDDLPVAEEVPIQSTNNAPTDARTTVGGANTPHTGIHVFPDLSQETDEGEITETMEDDVEEDSHRPEDGGTTMGTNLEDPETLLDLTTQQSTECDEKLLAVYGDTTHQNDGRHLQGGVADNTVWQARFDRVVAYPHKLYFPPQGQVSKLVVATYSRELKGIRERRWNSE